MGKQWKSGWLYFWGLQNHCRWWLQLWNLKMLTPWKESYDQPREHIKKQRHYFVNKGPSSQGYGFSSSHVWMWELDYKESWAPKNWCFWTVVLEKTLESPLGCKKIQPVHPKGDQSWVFIGRTHVEAETPILWPPDVKSWLIWKDPNSGKDWRQEEKGRTEDDMTGCHHWLNRHEFGETPGVGDGQGGLACCGSWGHKESDTSERLNWTEEYYSSILSYCLSGAQLSTTVCSYSFVESERQLPFLSLFYGWVACASQVTIIWLTTQAILLDMEVYWDRFAWLLTFSLGQCRLSLGPPLS